MIKSYFVLCTYSYNVNVNRFCVNLQSLYVYILDLIIANLKIESMIIEPKDFFKVLIDILFKLSRLSAAKLSCLIRIHKKPLVMVPCQRYISNYYVPSSDSVHIIIIPFNLLFN